MAPETLPLTAAETPLAISALESATPTAMRPPPPAFEVDVAELMPLADTDTDPLVVTLLPMVAVTPASDPMRAVAPPPPRLTPRLIAVTSVSALTVLGPTAVTTTEPELVMVASASAVTGASITALEEMPVPANPRPMLVAPATTFRVVVCGFTPPDPSGVPVSASSFTCPLAPMLPPPALAWIKAFFVITAST